MQSQATSHAPATRQLNARRPSGQPPTPRADAGNEASGAAAAALVGPQVSAEAVAPPAGCGRRLIGWVKRMATPDRCRVTVLTLLSSALKVGIAFAAERADDRSLAGSATVVGAASLAQALTARLLSHPGDDDRARARGLQRIAEQGDDQARATAQALQAQMTHGRAMARNVGNLCGAAMAGSNGLVVADAYGLWPDPQAATGPLPQVTIVLMLITTALDFLSTRALADWAGDPQHDQTHPGEQLALQLGRLQTRPRIEGAQLPSEDEDSETDSELLEQITHHDFENEQPLEARNFATPGHPPSPLSTGTPPDHFTSDEGAELDHKHARGPDALRRPATASAAATPLAGAL